MMDQNDVMADLLRPSGGGRSAKFTEHGDTFKGEITEISAGQVTDYTTGQPAFWDNGQPKMQLIITLATDAHVDDDDDGMRRLYAPKGSGDMHRAILAAIGDDPAAFKVGGTLAVRYTGDAPVTSKSGVKLNPKKLFVAQYQPPADNRGPVEDLLGNGNSGTVQAADSSELF